MMAAQAGSGLALLFIILAGISVAAWLHYVWQLDRLDRSREDADNAAMLRALRRLDRSDQTPGGPDHAS
jgi:hypothetical protein